MKSKATEGILVAVDNTSASERAVSYLGRVLSGTASRIHLFHVVEPIAPTWACVHGDLMTQADGPAGDPESDLIEEAKKRSRPIFEKMTAILTEAGVPSERIASSWYTASREDSLVAEILEFARRQKCGTVVVGRAALPWYRELFRQHVAKRLVKKGEGLSVWVVE